ncbi:hypothetical protein HRR83_006207 [Exophiala dermatitidis]|uniref:Uncharacterized protein n=1 Tax=Exophiala dermatitidis TaxID=5970 RepID=A0AAN6EJX2_EXODE|nr:hypothetical protein HRR73_008685 [Exophiala dermatitidis]KAJ4515139.1 hypothetical protein HRR74_005604 [Exophiala dermatitidis]KAJ4548609.1 hypothetical protein HRR76_001200 [Exophiala dermatitidis]KAJ4552670.1 hypothetical protein HRR77_002670 [Exophiala dermatitidis]KAJ4554809.1 hypothetical protein HRR79_009252 [Exophiala dermatitidis]
MRSITTLRQFKNIRHTVPKDNNTIKSISLTFPSLAAEPRLSCARLRSRARALSPVDLFVSRLSNLGPLSRSLLCASPTTGITPTHVQLGLFLPPPLTPDP